MWGDTKRREKHCCRMLLDLVQIGYPFCTTVLLFFAVSYYAKSHANFDQVHASYDLWSFLLPFIMNLLYLMGAFVSCIYFRLKLALSEEVRRGEKNLQILGHRWSYVPLFLTMRVPKSGKSADPVQVALLITSQIAEHQNLPKYV